MVFWKRPWFSILLVKVREINQNEYLVLLFCSTTKTGLCPKEKKVHTKQFLTILLVEKNCVWSCNLIWNRFSKRFTTSLLSSQTRSLIKKVFLKSFCGIFFVKLKTNIWKSNDKFVGKWNINDSVRG